MNFPHKLLSAIFALMILITRRGAALTVTQVAANHDGAFFILSDGSLWAIGHNGSGILGLGNQENAVTPVMIVSNGVVAVSIGFEHSAFVKSDGSLWMTGDNSYGQLGDGTTNSHLFFQQVQSANVKAVSCGYFHTLFVTTTTTGTFPRQTITQNLYSVGNNAGGELGDGTTNNRSSPYLIQSTNFIGVTPCFAGAGHSIFLEPNGAMWGMGYNALGTLGDGNTNDLHQPGILQNSGVISVYAGPGRTFYIGSDETLHATGNNFGILGDGTSTDRDTFEKIDTNVVSVGGGNTVTLYVKNNGNLWVVGQNQYAQLGDGTYTDKLSPELIATNATYATANQFASYYISTDGSLWGAGADYAGQLGDDLTSNATNFVRIYPRPDAQLNGADIRSNSNLHFYGTCGIGGYYALLTSTNLYQPVNSWTPVSTNLVQNRGVHNYDVILTNSLNRAVPASFYALRRVGD